LIVTIAFLVVVVLFFRALALRKLENFCHLTAIFTCPLRRTARINAALFAAARLLADALCATVADASFGKP